MSFENLDCFLSGTHPTRFQKPSGKKKGKKKRAASGGDPVDSAQDFTVPDPAPDPAPQSASEVARLHAALEAEQRNRTRLESRLEDLEARLAQVLATTDGAAAEAAREELALHDLRAQLQFELEIQEQQEVLETWMLEATLRADDQARALKLPAKVVQQPIPQPLYHEPQTPARPSDDRLREARVAMEAAEARAAHNASQVRKLTEELAAARAEQIRTSARLKELSARLDLTESTIDASVNRYLDLPAAPDPWEAAPPVSSDMPLPPSVPEDASATRDIDAPWEVEDKLADETSTFHDVTPESPFEDVSPEKEVVEAPDDETPAVNLAEDLESPGLSVEAPVEPSEPTDLAASLLAWGGDDTTPDPAAVETPEEDPFKLIADIANDGPGEQVDSTDATGLEDALAAWGAGEIDAPSAPEETVEVLPAAPPSENDFTESFLETGSNELGTGDDIFDTLADALTSWGQGDSAPVTDAPTFADEEPEIMPDLEEVVPDLSASELDEAPVPEQEDLGGAAIPEQEDFVDEQTFSQDASVSPIIELELPDVPAFAPEDIPETDDTEEIEEDDSNFAVTPVTGIDAPDPFVSEETEEPSQELDSLEDSGDVDASDDTSGKAEPATAGTSLDELPDEPGEEISVVAAAPPETALEDDVVEEDAVVEPVVEADAEDDPISETDGETAQVEDEAAVEPVVEADAEDDPISEIDDETSQVEDEAAVEPVVEADAKDEPIGETDDETSQVEEEVTPPSVESTDTVVDDDLPKLEDEIDTIDAPEIHPDDVISDPQEPSYDEAANQDSAWETPPSSPGSSILDRMVGQRGKNSGRVRISESPSEEIAADAVFRQGRAAEEAGFAAAHTDFTPEPDVVPEPSAQRESIANNLHGWSGMSPRGQDEDRPRRESRARLPEAPQSDASPMNPPPRARRAAPRPEGKKAMMNALMRFMGTDDEK